jgi:Uma2 family endonuclease
MVFSPPEQRVILRHVSWGTYERLLAEHLECSSPRFTYDRGMLEIMVVSAEHERPNRLLASLFEVLAEEMDIDFENLGSNTFKREDLTQGFEPDTCFYIQQVERIRGKTRLDLTIDPPPDLVIEIDITSDFLNKLPIYAAVGVPEVWRYDGQDLTIFRLTGDAYSACEDSVALPGVTRTRLAQFMEDSTHMRRTAWVCSVRAWASAQGKRLG